MTLPRFRSITRVLTVTATLAAPAACPHGHGATLAAQHGHDHDSAADISGAWQLSVMHGDHGVPFGLELKQDHTAVSGTLFVPALHGGASEKVAVEGTFVEQALSLKTPAEGSSVAAGLTIVGKLKDDGTFEGTLTGKMGTMDWTATRLGSAS